MTSWRPPTHIRNLSREEADQLRKKKGINVEGENVPPPIGSFIEMKFPRSILNVMKSKNIVSPTVIQSQGMSVALSGVHF
jgi:ATP-dependent RNA helicase DDX41